MLTWNHILNTFTFIKKIISYMQKQSIIDYFLHVNKKQRKSLHYTVNGKYE